MAEKTEKKAHKKEGEGKGGLVDTLKRNRLFVILGVVGIVVIAVAAIIFFILPSGGNHMIVGFPSRSGKIDLELLRLGDSLQDSTRLVNDAEIGLEGISVYDGSQFEKFIDSGGFLPDSDYVFVVYRDDEEIRVEYLKIGEDRPEIAVEAEGVFSASVFPDTNTLLYSEKKNESARCFFLPFGDFETRMGRGDQCYFSPDGTQIFVEDSEVDEYDLSVVDVKRGEETKLISKDEPIEDFIISDDGKYIVYEEITSSGYQLFMVDTAEGKEEAIGEDYYSILTYQFLPKSQNGFFIAENYDGTLSLIDFQDAKTVTSALFLNAMSSPSGDYLIYVVGDEEEENTIYSYSFNDGTSEEILDGGMIAFSILESPEKVILFDVDEEDEVFIAYLCDVDGSNLVEALDEEEIYLEGVFHAEGQKSVFFVFETEDGIALYTTSVDSDTTGYYLVEEWFDIRLLTQSADDKTLIFAGREDDGDDFTLYSVEIAETGRFIELDDQGDAFLNAVFTPKNDSVLYTVVTGSNPDDRIVYEVNAFGEGRPEELFDEAVLIDVEWTDMNTFGEFPWFVIREGTSYCPGAALLVDGVEVASELVEEEDTCFRMTASEGDIVTFATYSAQQSSGFDMTLSLYDRNGVLLTEVDNSLWGFDPRLTYTFEEAGIYFVKIKEKSEALGEFTIETTLREDAFANARSIEIEDATRGTITPESGIYLADFGLEFYGEMYYFEAEEGDRLAIDVVAEALNSDLDPAVTLFNTDREEIREDDNSGEGNDARVLLHVPSSGGYYFVVHDSEGRPPSSGEEFDYEVSISYREGVSVAILDHSTKSDLPYFGGGNNENSYELIWELLLEDDSGDFLDIDVVSDLSAATLSQYDRLVLPDNAVPEKYLDDVEDWFTSGKTILGMDSAISYFAYAGYIWSDAAGGSGSDYYKYRTINGLEIVESSGTTSSYSVGTVFSTQQSDAWLYVDKLPTDVTLLAVYFNDSNYAGIVEMEVPGHGKIVFFGPYVSDFEDYATLVADALR